MSYYPISLYTVKKKVESKVKRSPSKQNRSILNFPDNVKEVTNNFGETLTRVDGEIPVDLEVKKGQRFLFISYDQSKYSHGIHKYPAKFFPELPRWLIKRYSKENDLILDPFAGSATTNIEALLSNRHSVGIDVDPFAKFLAKVKTTPLNLNEVKRVTNELLTKLVQFKPSLVSNEDLPDFPYRDNWFKHDILLELAYIKKNIADLTASQPTKDFYSVCFSSIIRAVSNADDNCTRTVVRKKLNKQVYPSMALTKFAENLLTFQARMSNFSKICPLDITTEFPENNDARYLTYPDNNFDLAVTSPPYVNAVDYPRTHQLEIYWLGFVSGSLTPLKKKHVGTESVKVANYKDLHIIGVPEADKILSTIFEKDPRRAYIAYKYLYDMNLNLQEVYRTLKKGGKYVIVVGNNCIRGQLFESWRYLMPLAEQIGYKIDTYFGSEIIKHFIKVPRESRINTDWVIVLEK